jgi:hypothetical protein
MDYSATYYETILTAVDEISQSYRKLPQDSRTGSKVTSNSFYRARARIPGTTPMKGPELNPECVTVTSVLRQKAEGVKERLQSFNKRIGRLDKAMRPKQQVKISFDDVEEVDCEDVTELESYMSPREAHAMLNSMLTRQFKAKAAPSLTSNKTLLKQKTEFYTGVSQTRPTPSKLVTPFSSKTKSVFGKDFELGTSQKAQRGLPLELRPEFSSTVYGSGSSPMGVEGTARAVKRTTESLGSSVTTREEVKTQAALKPTPSTEVRTSVAKTDLPSSEEAVKKPVFGVLKRSDSAPKATSRDSLPVAKTNAPSQDSSFPAVTSTESVFGITAPVNSKPPQPFPVSSAFPTAPSVPVSSSAFPTAPNVPVSSALPTASNVPVTSAFPTTSNVPVSSAFPTAPSDFKPIFGAETKVFGQPSSKAAESSTSFPHVASAFFKPAEQPPDSASSSVQPAGFSSMVFGQTSSFTSAPIPQVLQSQTTSFTTSSNSTFKDLSQQAPPAFPGVQSASVFGSGQSSSLDFFKPRK